MHQLESWRSRQSVLPLPPASLIVDLRADEDDMIDRLRIEIADLTNEMRMLETHHWRLLADFLSFRHIPPMGAGEISTLRPQQDAGAGTACSEESGATGNGSQAVQPLNDFQPGLTGPIISSAQKLNNSTIFFDDTVGLRELSGNQPIDILKQYAEEIVDETDRLRNNRMAAISDLDPDLVGTNVGDKAVRIILVVDAEQPDSLASAAACAEQLRQFRARKQRANQELMLNLTVLCLNVSGEPDSQELNELLWDGRWDHVDSLIISECYRYDGVRIAGSIQTYLAELLLYVLLIVPPVPVNLAPSPAFEQGTAGERPVFPPNTFLVGLAAMEHSARWGKHLLNFKVVERSIEVLQEDCEHERERTTDVARSWLNHWRGKLRSLIPQHVPETIRGIQGITQATNALQPPGQVFTLNSFSWSLSKATLVDLRRYLATLTATYIQGEQAQGGNRVLQDALNSIPQLEQQLKIWESKETDQRKEIPLASVQLEAQRVLSHRDFFSGAQGAISRAKIQLEELSRAIGELRASSKGVNLKECYERLERTGNEKIEALAGDIQSIPRVGTLPFLRSFMAWVSLLLLLGLGVVSTFLAMAWLHYFLLGSSFTPFFNDLLLYSISPLALIFWTPLLLLVLALIFFPARRLLSTRRSPWSVEIGFVLVLLVLALAGWLLQLSALKLTSDAVGAALLGWLDFFPAVGGAALTLAVLLVIGECLYFLWWFNNFLEQRAGIVRDLNEMHTNNINAVSTFIADNLAFFILERTELISGRNGPGKYYERLNKLNDHCRELLRLAGERQKMVRRRLGLSFSETQPGTKQDAQGPWLNLRIRDEHLDVDTLADGYARLNERLGQEMDELRDLAEQLLRAMGQEQPAVLEKEFRERSQVLYSIRRHPQVLMATLVATAQRVSIESEALTSIQPLIERYKALEASSSNQLYLMKALIDTISHRLTRMMLEPMLSGQVQSTRQDIHQLSIDAFETWGQMLWANQDQELDRALASTGIMPRLLETQDNSAFVKRLLALRTSLFGQSVQPGQAGDLFVLVPPSPQSYTFRQSLNLSRRHLIEFPDVERLVLLYIQRYLPASSAQVMLPPDISASSAPAARTEN